MKKLKSLLFNCGGILASLALIVGISSTNAACVWFFHQPKVPNGMRAYKKHQ